MVSGSFQYWTHTLVSRSLQKNITLLHKTAFYYTAVFILNPILDIWLNKDSEILEHEQTYLFRTLAVLLLNSFMCKKVLNFVLKIRNLFFGYFMSKIFIVYAPKKVRNYNFLILCFGCLSV